MCARFRAQYDEIVVLARHFKRYQLAVASSGLGSAEAEGVRTIWGMGLSYADAVSTETSPILRLISSPSEALLFVNVSSQW